MSRVSRAAALTLAGLMTLPAASLAGTDEPESWIRHTIDDTSQGADGVRLADANGDGLLDIATGWEEGGLVRVYLNPGPSGAKQLWPRVTVGRVASPEDAVLVDLDGDDAVDVVSATEGKTRTLWVHWAPGDPGSVLDPASWRTEAIPASRGALSWMFVVPHDINEDGRVDLVAGAKGPGAQVGWLEAPPAPRRLADWRWHPLRDAGWIMSLVLADMNGDGDEDIAVSDRKGEERGVFWLENPGPASLDRPWREHAVGAQGGEVMFLTVAPADRDTTERILVSTKPREIVLLERRGATWTETAIPTPDTAGTAKAVTTGDVDGDGVLDLVFSCEGAEGLSGVMWLSAREAGGTESWTAHGISGRAGTKFDLVELIDLDHDGDLDVLTCEEREGLGVVWYENPYGPAAVSPAPSPR